MEGSFSPLRVFISTRESRCDECGADLGLRALIFLAGDRGALCLRCADLEYSGRVGRSAAAKRLDEDAVQLAVAAHVRHEETAYDELLGRGVERWEARRQVAEQVDSVLARWRNG